MTILFAGNQMQDFVTNALVSEVTTAGRFDSAWVPNACHVASGTAPMRTPIFTSQTLIWIHWEGWNTDASSTLQAFFQAYNSSTTAVVRLLATNGTPVNTSLQYWTGSAWTTIGTGSFSSSALHQHDVFININGASSVISWYVDQTLQVTGTGDYSSVGNIAQAGWQTHRLNGSTDISEVIIATTSTMTKRYNLRLPNAAGTNSGFTGAYTDVNEAITNNTTFISTTTNNVISTFQTAGKTLTGYNIDAVIVTHLSMRDDTTGPQNSQVAICIGGTNYFGPTEALDLSWGSHRYYMPLDPSTSAAWTTAVAGAAALEPGVKAIA